MDDYEQEEANETRMRAKRKGERGEFSVIAGGQCLHLTTARDYRADLSTGISSRLSAVA